MKKILLVDDDRAVVEVLTQALKKDGRAICFARDGEAALRWIGRETFDLVICDLMMPKAHGYHVVEQVRTAVGPERTRIIVLTAKSFARDADRARQAGADLVITKPFDLADLAGKVERLLN